MTFCQPCREEGREQVHHAFLEQENGLPPLPVCRWHFKGLPYPAGREVVKAGGVNPPLQEGTMASGHSRRKIEIDEARFRELYAKGLNDGQIGMKLGCSYGTAGKFRKTLGLPKQSRVGRPRAKPGSASREWNSMGLNAAGQESKRRPGRPRGSGRVRGTQQAEPIAIELSRAVKSNGHGALVPVRVELLDAFWAVLEPGKKAELLNRAVESTA